MHNCNATHRTVAYSEQSGFHIRNVTCVPLLKFLKKQLPHLGTILLKITTLVSVLQGF